MKNTPTSKIQKETQNLDGTKEVKFQEIELSPLKILLGVWTLGMSHNPPMQQTSFPPPHTMATVLMALAHINYVI